MKIGTIDVVNFMLGNIQVEKIYLGTTEVWTNENTEWYDSEE